MIEIEAGQYQNAIVTYNEDLKHFPKNGWAQHGLMVAYEKLNDVEKVKKTKALFEKSWEFADIKL